jgi:hypothetical protein
MLGIAHIDYAETLNIKKRSQCGDNLYITPVASGAIDMYYPGGFHS